MNDLGMKNRIKLRLSARAEPVNTITSQDRASSPKKSPNSETPLPPHRKRKFLFAKSVLLGFSAESLIEKIDKDNRFF